MTDFMLHEPSGMLVRRDGAYKQQDMTVVHEVVMSDGYFTRLRGTKGEGEFVVDIGAHIGCFAMMWHRKNPLAKIVCVEACPENIDILKANVGEFATVIHAACTYETDELVLLNSVKAGGTATGGSMVVTRKVVAAAKVGHFYWQDERPLRKVTLEEIMSDAGATQIDILKLDCEGSEFSILGDTPSLDNIRFMCGEYHGLARWDQFRKERLKGWDYGHMHSAGGLGIFHYVHPNGSP